MKYHALDFESTIMLENERVRLEPFDSKNIEELSHFSVDEPELWKYSLIPANGKKQYEYYIKKALLDRKNQTCYPFAVYDKKTKQYAGSTRFYDYQKYHQATLLGFTWYGKDFQGTGLNKHCKFLMLEYAFEYLGLERVEFRADAANTRSIAAMKRIGCTVEGVLRSNCKSLDGRRDSIVLSILREEWVFKIKKLLKSYLE